MLRTATSSAACMWAGRRGARSAWRVVRAPGVRMSTLLFRIMSFSLLVQPALCFHSDFLWLRLPRLHRAEA